MHPTLAQNLTVRIGNGIAGQVAQSGQPLLVNDIGRDGRFTIGRRPRFKTGSFICLPLHCNGETLGVLNLADRTNQTPFGQADLGILSTLASHAAALMRRTRTHEGAMHLEKLSITDPLTELYNRRFLERRMEEEMSRSIRHGLQLSIMILDLDTFKAYNDLCGHQAGDRALQQVAKVLCRSVREMDIVTRYGGEEFCILLPDTPKVDAMFVAERIRYGIEHEFFNGEEGLPLGRLTISIGIATYPENGATSSELVSSADMALYQAKADGRNRIVASHDLPVSTGHFRVVSRSATLQTH
jgi:diguanylate cyclase (GGDEF)-like protein